jgi:hypothetical protein
MDILVLHAGHGHHLRESGHAVSRFTSRLDRRIDTLSRSRQSEPVLLCLRAAASCHERRRAGIRLSRLSARYHRQSQPDAGSQQQLGGGFLAFTVDLSVDDVQLKEVRRRLGQFADGTVELAPLPYRSGTVRLSITKDTAEAPGAAADTPKGVSFFEEVYGTSKPSLLGGNRATFGVMMDHEGALLMEAALKSGISPIGVIYDLEYLGMRPAFNVKITADYKRIYNHLEMQFGIRGGVGPITAAVDIGMAWQKLREDGSIKVEVTNFTDDENFRKQADAAFDWFKTELLRDFFKSSLEPPSFMKQGQSSNMLGALQIAAWSLDREPAGADAAGHGGAHDTRSNAERAADLAGLRHADDRRSQQVRDGCGSATGQRGKTRRERHSVRSTNRLLAENVPAGGVEDALVRIFDAGSGIAHGSTPRPVFHHRQWHGSLSARSSMSPSTTTFSSM